MIFEQIWRDKREEGQNNSMKAMIIMDSNKQRKSDNNEMEYILVKRETMLRVVAKFRQFLRGNF